MYSSNVVHVLLYCTRARHHNLKEILSATETGSTTHVCASMRRSASHMSNFDCAGGPGSAELVAPPTGAGLSTRGARSVVSPGDTEAAVVLRAFGAEVFPAAASLAAASRSTAPRTGSIAKMAVTTSSTSPRNGVTRSAHCQPPAKSATWRTKNIAQNLLSSHRRMMHKIWVDMECTNIRMLKNFLSWKCRLTLPFLGEERKGPFTYE